MLLFFSFLQNKTAQAEAYHAMLADTSGVGPETVIVDVRNAYESAIGHFAPPKGGATLIDPQMRNSHDFPGWLAKPEVQAQLHGKRVRSGTRTDCLCLLSRRHEVEEQGWGGGARERAPS
jgi:hypothetical protein